MKEYCVGRDCTNRLPQDERHHAMYGNYCNECMDKVSKAMRSKESIATEIEQLFTTLQQGEEDVV